LRIFDFPNKRTVQEILLSSSKVQLTLLEDSNPVTDRNENKNKNRTNKLISSLFFEKEIKARTYGKTFIL